MSHGWNTCNICHTHYHDSENDGDCTGCDEIEAPCPLTVEEQVLAILRDSLTVDVDIGHEYGYYGERISIRLRLNGKTISETSASLPSHN